MSFINDNFMLKNEPAKKLYAMVKDLPIIDYHCHLSPKDQVNVKATTEEKLGFTGRLEGASAHAVCLISK